MFQTNATLKSPHGSLIWQPFLNEVGWFRTVAPKEQSKLYIFGERILSVEDGNYCYMIESIDMRCFYNIEKDVIKAKLGHKEIIDEEANLNNTRASYLFFMNDRTAI